MKTPTIRHYELDARDPGWTPPTRKLFGCVSATLIAVALAVPAFGGTIPANVCPIDPQTKLITYAAVVPVPGVSAAELYSRARLWVANTYRSAKAVIDLDDKDAGRIVAKGVFTVPYAGLSSMNIRGSLTIEVKDGRFRYTLTDLRAFGQGNYGPFENAVESQAKNPFTGKKFWQRINAECIGTVESLAKAMTVPAAAAAW
jgi:hypothetical protein